MSTAKRWTVEILLDEADEGTTRAVARLDTSEDAHVHGRGAWHRADDGDVAEVGNDVAVAQALAEIAEKLAIRAADASRASATLAAVAEA